LNIGGLTFGLSCFLLIGLYLFDELTFDTQHTKGDRIYRVIAHRNNNGEATVIAAGSYPLAEESRKTITGVENATRMIRAGRANLLNPENPTHFFQETITIADQQLLKIFDFPLLSGDRHTALQEPNSIVLSEDLAHRLFNTTDVLGKTVQFSHMEAPLKITGVLKNHPRNSSFDFTSLISESSFYGAESDQQQAASDWSSDAYTVYCLLKPAADPGAVSSQLTQLVHANFKPPVGTSLSYRLQPLQDLHLKSAGIVDGARNPNVAAIPQGNPMYLKLFAFIALFVLLTAGINYMNLTTARASSRLKEIGVRKTVGALKRHLTWQFLVESLLVTGIAFQLSLVVVNLVLPAFNQFAHKALSLNLSTDYRIWLFAILFVVLTGLLSGSYPALLLSRFRPVSLLKNLKLQNRTDLSLRKGMVVFQFTLSVVMIIATLVLFLQVRYLHTAQLGFNKDLLVVIDMNTSKAKKNFEAVKTEMAKIPTVKNVSVTSRVPGEWKAIRTVKIKNQGDGGAPKQAYLFGADKDFLKTYGIPLVSGRNFDTAADSSGVLVNETAAKMLGIQEPSGQVVEIPAFAYDRAAAAFESLAVPYTPRVIGIVKDFHFQSLHEKVEPLVLAYHQNPIHGIDYYSVRIDAGNIAQTLAKLKTVLINNDKEDPFEYHFLDEQLALFYVEDERRQTILLWVAIATIFIACLGLFGLATYAAEQRTKEIGVRKVLGATVFGLASLLSKDFLKLVLLSNVIAFPIAWWATNKWLQEYAYHIEVEWWMFLVAGVLAIGIALLTICYQAIRAARRNPVKSLRTE
jgi:putative ABC transport system permease protein